MIQFFGRFFSMLSLAVEGMESFVRAFNGIGKLAEAGVDRIHRELINDQAQLPK